MKCPLLGRRLAGEITGAGFGAYPRILTAVTSASATTSTPAAATSAPITLAVGCRTVAGFAPGLIVCDARYLAGAGGTGSRGIRGLLFALSLALTLALALFLAFGRTLRITLLL